MQWITTVRFEAVQCVSAKSNISIKLTAGSLPLWLDTYLNYAVGQKSYKCQGINICCICVSLACLCVFAFLHTPGPKSTECCYTIAVILAGNYLWRQFHNSKARPEIIHNVPLCSSRRRKMNSSRREDLTFNSRLAGEPGCSEMHALTYGSKEMISFSDDSGTFSWRLFSPTLQKTGAERGQNALIWLFLGESGSIAFFLLIGTLAVWPPRAEECNHLRQAEHAFGRAWRGSDFNAPLWAALTANNINSSRKNTHSNTQTCRISARINTPRHKGNPSDRCGEERERGESVEHTHSKLLQTHIAQLLRGESQ